MTPVDCRSEVGVTVGLIDTIMTAANVLKGRDLGLPEVVEALKDLRSSEELRRLLIGGIGFNYDKVKRAYEIDALERIMEPRPQAANVTGDGGDGAKTTPKSE